MERLAKSVSKLKSHYDVIVIGSGYGGGVAASRLSRCGQRVCVLERGREFSLGDFPNHLRDAFREFQVTFNDRQIGNRQGLFDHRVGNGIHVFVGCGLGGTSLINANVSVPADEKVWQDPIWPKEITQDPWLKEGEARAIRMLQPVPTPQKIVPKKFSALQRSGKALGHETKRPPLNVTFEKRRNRAGIIQPGCSLCGDCCSGCNLGAKNTVQMTYLPDAVHHGTEVFTGTKVNFISKERHKWRIHFEDSESELGGPELVENSITSSIVILAAGTLGSTEILLRSGEKGLALSKQLGKGFSGNGGVIAFGFNNKSSVNAIGTGHPRDADVEPVGPCVTGVIDLRVSKTEGEDMIIEEGVIPSGLAPILSVLMSLGSISGISEPVGFRKRFQKCRRNVISLFKGAYKGAVHHTQIFLATAQDDAGGELRLGNKHLHISWQGLARQQIFQKIYDKFQTATLALGGTFIKNPLSSKLFGENMITVHPLGGCAIGRNSANGVVDHKCRVFDTGSEGDTKQVHQGLYVCDGAVMPRSLGINPLLTITSLAERAMMHIAYDRGWVFDDHVIGDPKEHSKETKIARINISV